MRVKQAKSRVFPLKNILRRMLERSLMGTILPQSNGISIERDQCRWAL